ncbi:MAG: hypothetical protein ACRCZF_11545, partial [Gemmataceae bacterium]
KNVVTWAINPATWNGVFIGGNGAVGGAHGALLAMELANVQGYAPEEVRIFADELNFYTERGFAHLLEGNIPMARKRFEQTRNPQGIEPPKNLTQRDIAEWYLRMMNMAGAKK